MRANAAIENNTNPIGKLKQGLCTVFIILCCLLVLPNLSAATVWTQVQLNGDGLGDSDNTAVTSMTTFSNFPIAGTSHLSTGQVWYYDGAAWTQLDNGWGGDANNTAIPSMAASGAYLFVGTRNEDTGAEVWLYNAGTWTQQYINGFGTPDNTAATSMIILSPYIYVGTENSSGAEVWEYYSGSGSWNDRSPNWLSSNTAIRSMAWLPPYLYVGTENSSGCEIWRSDGTWEQIQTGGFGDANNTAVTSMTASGYLFVGTKNEVTGAELWMYNAGTDTWTQQNTDGFGNDNNTAALSMAVLGSYIYVGTENSNTGAEVWRSDIAWNWKKEGNGWDGDANNTAITSMQVNGVSGADMLYMGFSNQTTGSQVWRGKTYDNIQPAIDDSIAGSTVLVEAGTYSEKVRMKDGVNLVAEEGVKPTIAVDSHYDDGVVVFTGPMACNLTGFTIQYTSMGSGVFVDGSGGQVNATIANCEMLSGGGFGCGIRLKDTVNVTITGCEIYRSTGGMRVGIGNSAMLVDRLSSSSSVTIQDTTIGGSGQGVSQAGIRLRGATGASNIQVTIGGSGIGDSNTISHSGFVGIVMTDIDKVTIENNDISNNGKAGILLLDTSTVSPHIKNNTIHDNTQAAGINIGGASNVTIGDRNDIYNNETGVAFYVANNSTIDQAMDDFTKTVSSQPVTITGNNIYSNTKVGIAVIDNVTGTIYIDDNKIYQNTKAGIAIFNECTAEITDNEIYTHTGAAGIFTGDWSGTFGLHAGTGFYRDNGPANLTIQRNTVYGNRAGMRLDHASGTITNNLVYNNSRAGIRFSGNSVSPYAPFTGSWGITEIMNNTVDDNGNGGIVYDDISDTTGRPFDDPPVGATQDAITIKNNIVTNNLKAGIKFCADNSGDDRSYNLFYNNQQADCTAGNCGRKCRSKTLGRCDAPGVNCCAEESWADFAVVDFPGAWATGEICGQDPLFNADYTLQGGSPAIGTGSDSNDMGAYGGT